MPPQLTALCWGHTDTTLLLESIQETGGSAQDSTMSHLLKRKPAFGERCEIAAARVVKSLDKIFNMEKKRALANC